MLEYRPVQGSQVASVNSTVAHGARARSIAHTEDGKRDFDSHPQAPDFQLPSPKAYCEAVKSHVTPAGHIQKLPPEILGEIFVWCIPTNVCSSSPLTSAPLLLVKVCRKWRNVALNTPQLWTKLYLHGLQGVNPVVFTSTSLRHSGVLPIDLYINPLTWYYPVSLDLFRISIIPDTIKLLAAEFHRVRTLHTTNFPAVIQGLFPESSHIDAPRLQHLRITSSPKSLGHVLTGHINAPNLESLEVCDPHITLQSISLNYHRLQCLVWNGSNVAQSWSASLNHLIPLLQMCPNLKECDIIRPRPFEHFVNPSTIISLPRLRRLSLLWKETVDMAEFLQLLEFGALESLRFEMEQTTSTRATLQRILDALLPPHKSTQPLKELHVVNLDISMSGGNPAFTASLHLLPTLECLRLEDCSIHGGFLAELTPETNASPSSWTLPKLEELHVSRVDLDGPRLVRMVAARTRSASSFRVLSLLDCGGVSSLDDRVLRALADRRRFVIQ